MYLTNADASQGIFVFMASIHRQRRPPVQKHLAKALDTVAGWIISRTSAK